MLETVRTEQASQVEDLSERLSDTLHEKKLVVLRLQSLTHAYEQEMGSLREKIRQLQSGALDRVSCHGNIRQDMCLAESNGERV